MIDIHPLEGLTERFLSESNYSSSTMKSYRIAYKHFILYLKEHDLIHATTKDVINYRNLRRERGDSSEYIHIEISALKSLYRYLRFHQKALGLSESYAFDIMAPIQGEVIHYKVKKRILSVDEARILIEKTRESRRRVEDYRNHAIIYLMITSGLRSDEIIHAKKKDLGMMEGKPMLYLQKEGQSDRDYVNIAKGAYLAITDYLKRRKDQLPYLFVSAKQKSTGGFLSRTFFYRMFPKLLTSCGLDAHKVTPHSLRHTAGILNLMRGASLESTKSFLRHKDMASTMVYQDYLDRIHDHTEEMIEAYILREDHPYDGFAELYVIIE